MRDKTQRTLRRPYAEQFYRGNRTAYCVMLLASALISMLNLAVAWLIQQIIDAVSGQPGALGIGALTSLTVGIILLIIPIKALDYMSSPRFI